VRIGIVHVRPSEDARAGPLASSGSGVRSVRVTAQHLPVNRQLCDVVCLGHPRRSASRGHAAQAGTKAVDDGHAVGGLVDPGQPIPGAARNPDMTLCGCDWTLDSGARLAAVLGEFHPAL
jgi:hypothetical protein